MHAARGDVRPAPRRPAGRRSERLSTRAGPRPVEGAGRCPGGQGRLERAPAGPVAARAGASDRGRRAGRNRAAGGDAYAHRGARPTAQLDRRPLRGESARMLAEAPEGPLHGVPVAIKDQFALPWRAPRDGAYKNAFGIEAGESGIFRRLRDAGAVIVGRDAHARVRPRFDRPHLRLRSVRKPVGHVALRRRLVGRLGGRGRGAPRGGSGRHGRRRLDSVSVRLLRSHRPEADVGPDPDRRLHSRLSLAWHRRPDLPRRRRRAPAGRGAARPPRRERARRPAYGSACRGRNSGTTSTPRSSRPARRRSSACAQAVR